MTTTEQDLRADWQRWHDEREAELAGPHGWLSLTALHWLDEHPASFPDLPGTWRARDTDTVEITATAADDVRLPDGTVVDGTAVVAPVDGLPGVLVSVGERVVEIARRTDDHALRVRDPHAATRAAFTGVPAWPVDERWVRTATFTPYAAPRRVTVDAVVEGLNHFPTAVGTVTFDVGGERQTLVALEGTKHDGLILHFRDGTSGRESYGGGRNLRTAPPDPDGTLVVDLNRVTNLPCAFTAFATCPLPPAENTLTVRIEAGEKLPL